LILLDTRSGLRVRLRCALNKWTLLAGRRVSSEVHIRIYNICIGLSENIDILYPPKFTL